MNHQEEQVEKSLSTDQVDKPKPIPRSRWPLVFAVLVIVGIVLLSLSITVFRPSSAHSKSVTATSDGGKAFSMDAQKFDDYSSEKESWPECVGMKAEQARLFLLEETHNAVQVEIIPQDSIVTADYRTDRVRVFVSEDGIVTKEPRIG